MSNARNIAAIAANVFWQLGLLKSMGKLCAFGRRTSELQADSQSYFFPMVFFQLHACPAWAPTYHSLMHTADSAYRLCQEENCNSSPEECNYNACLSFSYTNCAS